jgi:phage portal protein BeeE
MLQNQNQRRTALETLYLSYQKNAWVNRAINAIASSVIANGWKPQPLDVTAQPNQKAEHYLTKFLAQPNDRDSFEDCIQLIVIDLMISGDAYWEVSRLNSNTASKRLSSSFGNTLAKDSEYALIIQDSIDASMQELDGLPLALWHIDARTMTKQTDEHGRITGYTQILPEGKKIQFEPSQIMNFCLRGVQDEVYGSSPLAPLEHDLIIDLYRQTYIKAQLENSTKIGNIITMTDAPPEEMSRLQEWMNLRARGPANAGQNVVTNAGTEFVTAPPTPYDVEMDLANSLKEKIVCCLGIPLAKLGTADKGTLGDSTQDGANKTYIEVTVKPLARLIERQFNLHLIPDFQVVGVSGYGIAILTEDIDLISTQAEMLVNLIDSGVFTRNEARVVLKQVPFKDEGDVPIVMTSSGAMKLKDIEQNNAQMDAVNAKLDALAGLVGGMRDDAANTDADSKTVAPPSNGPAPEANDVQKALLGIAADLKKAISGD